MNKKVVRKMYFCRKCRYYHFINSNIFFKHRKYLIIYELPFEVLYEWIR